MKTRILLIAVAMLFAVCANAQTLILDPSKAFAKCPNEWIIYTVTNSSSAACNYTWTVTNGEVQGGSLNGNVSTFMGGNLVQIRWFDTTNNGQISVQGACNPSSGNGSTTVAFPILSINGVNPGSISGASSVTANVLTNQTYSVPQINFPNIGTGDVNPKQVSSYEWEIPTGWTVVSGGTSKSITVKPDNCSGGNIRARGKSTICTSGPYYSNWSTPLVISRTLPTPSTISGPATATCGSGGTLTYSVAAVSGAESYVWTVPSGWTGSSTTNSITVTHNNTNAGTISVKAKACTNALSSPSSLAITFTSPALSTPVFVAGSTKLLCSSGTGSVSISPIADAASYTWYTSGGSFYLNGSLVTSSNPITNTSTSVTVSVPAISGTNGYNNIVYVKANRAVSSCTGSPTTAAAVWAGKPVLPVITVDATDCPEFYFDSCPFTDQSITGYNWQYNQLPSGAINNNTTFSCSSRRYVLNSGNSYRVGVTGTNACGVGAFSLTTVTVSCSGSTPKFAIFPNPTSSLLTIEMAATSDSDTQFEIQLLDQSGSERLRQTGNGATAVVDIQNLEKGRYFVKVKTKKEVLQSSILIE